MKSTCPFLPLTHSSANPFQSCCRQPSIKTTIQKVPAAAALCLKREVAPQDVDLGEVRVVAVTLLRRSTRVGAPILHNSEFTRTHPFSNFIRFSASDVLEQVSPRCAHALLARGSRVTFSTTLISSKHALQSKAAVRESFRFVLGDSLLHRVSLL